MADPLTGDVLEHIAARIAALEGALEQLHTARAALLAKPSAPAEPEASSNGGAALPPSAPELDLSDAQRDALSKIGERPGVKVRELGIGPSIVSALSREGHIQRAGDGWELAAR